MTLFLPPAPHTGAFFDTVRAKLDQPTEAATYPGYGDIPALTTTSIEAYAASLLPVASGTILVGFHTGCLVAMEMAKQDPSVGQLILVDIPFFDTAKRTELSSGMDANDPSKAAFIAAFAYDVDATLSTLVHPVTAVATDSILFEPTRRAASMLTDCQLIEAKHITKPAFESDALAKLLAELLAELTADNSQQN